ncbi:MAG: hypothetical protein ACP5JP_00830, partial [bacterium]
KDLNLLYSKKSLYLRWIARPMLCMGTPNELSYCIFGVRIACRESVTVSSLLKGTDGGLISAAYYTYRQLRQTSLSITS